MSSNQFDPFASVADRTITPSGHPNDPFSSAYVPGTFRPEIYR